MSLQAHPQPEPQLLVEAHQPVMPEDLLLPSPSLGSSQPHPRMMNSNHPRSAETSAAAAAMVVVAMVVVAMVVVVMRHAEPRAATVAATVAAATRRRRIVSLASCTCKAVRSPPTT